MSRHIALRTAALIAAVTGAPVSAFRQHLFSGTYPLMLQSTLTRRGIRSSVHFVAAKQFRSRTNLSMSSAPPPQRKFSTTVQDIDRQLEADDPAAPPAPTEDSKVNLYSLSVQQLEDLLMGWGQPKYRSKQLHKWLYERGVEDFEKMLDIPKDLRAR